MRRTLRRLATLACDASADAEAIPVERFVRVLEYLEGLIDDGTLPDLRVVNMSFRLPLTAEDADASDSQAAIRRLTGKGVLFVASGGNGTYETGMHPDPAAVADLGWVPEGIAWHTAGSNGLSRT